MKRLHDSSINSDSDSNPDVLSESTKTFATHKIMKTGKKLNTLNRWKTDETEALVQAMKTTNCKEDLYDPEFYERQNLNIGGRDSSSLMKKAVRLFQHKPDAYLKKSFSNLNSYQEFLTWRNNVQSSINPEPPVAIYQVIIPQEQIVPAPEQPIPAPQISPRQATPDALVTLPAPVNISNENIETPTIEQPIQSVPGPSSAPDPTDLLLPEATGDYLDQLVNDLGITIDEANFSAQAIDAQPTEEPHAHADFIGELDLQREGTLLVFNDCMCY